MKEIQRIIRQLGEEDGFDTVVLTDESGLPLASTQDFEEAEALAAIIGQIQRFSVRALERWKLGKTSEILLISEDAKRGILCRQFEAGEHKLALAVVIRPDHVYWKATTKAIQEIKQSWRLRASDAIEGV
jgi:predicted regulator of Ras-like GTPase activity (Roadblock/LC7/MglB family)